MPLALRIPIAAVALAAGLFAAAPGATAAPRLTARTGGGVLTLTLSTGAPATGGPAPVSRIAFTLPPAIQIGGAAASCARATIERAPQTCPAASRVGAGTARWAGYNPYAPPVGQRVDPTSDISVFTGPGGAVLLRLPVARPIPQVIVLTAAVASDAGARRLLVAVPQTLIAGYDFTPIYLQLRLGGAIARGFVRRSGACPKKGGLPFGVELRYRARGAGQALRPQRASASASC